MACERRSSTAGGKFFSHNSSSWVNMYVDPHTDRTWRDGGREGGGEGGREGGMGDKKSWFYDTGVLQYISCTKSCIHNKQAKAKIYTEDTLSTELPGQLSWLSSNPGIQGKATNLINR